MEWLGVVEGVLVVLALAVLPLVLFALRRRWLARRGSMFECALRLSTRGTRAGTPGAGWALGVARYSGDRLEWFRVFSLAFRPRLEITRRGTTVLETRAPDDAEVSALYGNQRVVVLTDADGQQIELAMEGGSVTGFLSWLEAAPPETCYPV
ncbi:DUF2550 domain-containing protein [Auraticoccus monumenti]|uniref:DUF2550 domain-containing protein n=1 Tax=Auraticoccus monumenti TaxID=675864 RepID=A0A1G7AYL7_9ACTN|nr:DUF2550 domain-containing protein [Auraticoccus monumenti]SDE19802.1 Protein of unknown function [Auraticoccus monumenti]